MFSILLIGVGLSMDALAVAVANGLTIRNFGPRQAAVIGLYFGGFQCLMPLIGHALGSAVSESVSAWGAYISFFLLAFIGIKMLVEALRGDGTAGCMIKLHHGRLILMAVATSLDALVVGVSFAFMEEIRLLPACLLIGCTTFVICFFGGLAAGRVSGLSCKWAGALGGAVLCGIGVKFLLEGLGVL